MIAEIETERLSLRLCTLDDVEILVELDSDPAVMRYVTGGKPTPRADVEDLVRKTLGTRWIGREQARADFVGWFGLRSAPAPDERELGYRMRKVMWGRGYATEASRALLAFGFDELGLARIWAKAMTINDRSRAVMERLDMRYVRTFFAEYPDFVEGDEYGEVEYEMLAADWRR